MLANEELAVWSLRGRCLTMMSSVLFAAPLDIRLWVAPARARLGSFRWCIGIASDGAMRSDALTLKDGK